MPSNVNSRRGLTVPLKIAGKSVVKEVTDKSTQVDANAVWTSVKKLLRPWGIPSAGQLQTARFRFLKLMTEDWTFDTETSVAEYLYDYVITCDKCIFHNNTNDHLFMHAFPCLEKEGLRLGEPVKEGAQKKIFRVPSCSGIYLSVLKTGKDLDNFKRQIDAMKDLAENGFDTLKTTDIFKTPGGARAFLSVIEEAKPVRVLGGVFLKDPKKTKARSTLITTLKPPSCRKGALSVALDALKKLRTFIAGDESRRKALLSDLQCLVTPDGRLIWHDPTPFDIEIEEKTTYFETLREQLDFLIAQLQGMAEGK
jgi:hypothetical protein